MNDVAQGLRNSLADTFMFYLQAHIFHWNVQGPNFPQLHAFFGEIYEDAHEAVDAIAEHLRTLGELAPATLAALTAAASVRCDSNASAAPDMVAALDADNEKVMDTLRAAQAAAEDANKVGIANFLQDRIDRHAKWSWMLTATGKIGDKKTTMRRMILYDHAGT